MEDNIIAHFALPESLRDELGLPPKPDNCPPTPDIPDSDDEVAVAAAAAGAYTRPLFGSR
jgi:hypothetical protein